MRKMYFVSSWNEEKEKTWSGINWGLFCSLKKYFDLCDINIGHIKKPLYLRVWHKLLFGFNDFGYYVLKRCKKYMDKKLQDGIYFQFSSIVKDRNGISTYEFLDCSTNSVLNMYNNDHEMFKKSNFSTANYKYIKKRAEDEFEYFKTCAGVFTLCHWLVDDLINNIGLPAEKVHYAGSGINVDYNKIDESKKTGNKILFVGKDFERKGGYLVIEAFKELKKKYSEAELYVAGPKKNPISEDIDGYHFLGLCNREQLNELYNKCDVFAMPSYFEAFGIVFAEALCFGLPCLGRRCCDMPMIIDEGKTGEIVDNDDAKAASEKLYNMLVDKKYRETVHSKRDYYLSEYSWDKVAERIYNVISNDQHSTK